MVASWRETLLALARWVLGARMLGTWMSDAWTLDAGMLGAWMLDMWTLGAWTLDMWTLDAWTLDGRYSEDTAEGKPMLEGWVLGGGYWRVGGGPFESSDSWDSWRLGTLYKKRPVTVAREVICVGAE